MLIWLTLFEFNGIADLFVSKNVDVTWNQNLYQEMATKMINFFSKKNPFQFDMYMHFLIENFWGKHGDSITIQGFFVGIFLTWHEFPYIRFFRLFSRRVKAANIRLQLDLFKNIEYLKTTSTTVFDRIATEKIKKISCLLLLWILFWGLTTWNENRKHNNTWTAFNSAFSLK